MKKHNIKTLLIILMVGTLTQICTDMYLPSLPSIATYFHASTGQAQFTMTLLMLGVALSGLFYGPVSEIIGRRWTLIIGILIATVGSVICFFSYDIITLQIGRFIQGCGLGACSSLWRSILKDTYTGDELASISSYFSNFILLSVILAPFIGGYIEQYTRWQMTFVVLIIWSLIVLTMVWFIFKETGQHHGKHRSNLKFMLSAYKELFTSRSFMGFSFCSFLSFGGLFSWLTAGPVVLIKGAGISPVIFGWLSIITGIAMALGATVNGKLVRSIGSIVMMKIGWAIMSFAGVIMLINYYWWGINVYAILIPALIFIFGSSLTFANAFANFFIESDVNSFNSVSSFLTALDTVSLRFLRYSSDESTSPSLLISSSSLPTGSSLASVIKLLK